MKIITWDDDPVVQELAKTSVKAVELDTKDPDRKVRIQKMGDDELYVFVVGEGNQGVICRTLGLAVGTARSAEYGAVE